MTINETIAQDNPINMTTNEMLLELISTIKYYKNNWNDEGITIVCNLADKYAKMYFENLVISKFDYCLNTCWDAEDNRKLILKDNLTSIQFIKYFDRYFDEKDDFLENNLSKIPEIIEILRKYVKENFEKPKTTAMVK